MSSDQKLAAYPHLYSFTSTKSVVHWFQIIRNKSFQMYDDEVRSSFSIAASNRYYKPVKFPTKNIKTPVVLVYGGSDSLVDIDVMLQELPRHTVAKRIPHYEHLDFVWADDVDRLVFPHVFNALELHNGDLSSAAKGEEGLQTVVDKETKSSESPSGDHIDSRPNSLGSKPASETFSFVQ